MRLWLDEARPAPDATWTICRTVREAQESVRFSGGLVDAFSLDHDLSTEAIFELAPSGLDFVRWYLRNYPLLGLRASWEVHSQNPIGGGRMVYALWRAGYRVRWAPYGLGFGVTIG